MRENGELDVTIYEKVKATMSAIKKESVGSRQFPSTAD